MNKKARTQVDPIVLELVNFFQRNGCARRPSLDRRILNPGSYKMGYEIRLVAISKKELAQIRRLLKQAGLKSGTPYAKKNTWVQPVYGREAVECFVGWLELHGDKANPKVAAMKKLPKLTRSAPPTKVMKVVRKPAAPATQAKVRPKRERSGAAVKKKPPRK